MEYGCIGEKLPHSYSKEIHEKIGAYKYELKELSPLELGAFMEEKEFKAVNVTIPYKRAVIPYLYKTDPAAQKIGAVNTVVNRNGKLFGYNTDYYGMKALFARENMEFRGKKVMILGTGGTSRTAHAVVKDLGAAQTVTVSRKARENTVTYEEAVTMHNDAHAIVNTTPVGMFPNVFDAPVSLETFGKLEYVADAIYNPHQTRLVQAALKKGIKAQTGLYMLVAQAVRAYEIFMDTDAGDITERIYKEILASKLNIVLTGMPGCGKSTVGKLLAEKLKRPFYDTDDLIRDAAGCEISEIFSEKGEPYFRSLETDAIRSLSANAGCVIATGGGAVLKPENVDLLKMNGRLYFLDRPPELLIPTADRPLALTADAVFARYRERYEIYKNTADDTVPGGASPGEVAAEIERRHYYESAGR